MREHPRSPGPHNELSRFKMMIEASTEEVYLARPDGELVYVNEAAAKSLGYTVGEMLALGVPGFDPLIGPRFAAYFEEVKQREPQLSETCQITRDGRKVFKEMRSVYLNIEGDEYICGFGRDVTRRKEAEEALRSKTEELDRYFTNSLDLLCVGNTDGYFLRLNPQWEKTLGYSLSELEGSRFIDLVHPDDVAPTLEAVSALRGQKEILNFTNRYRCRDGTYRFIEWRSYPEGETIYAVARDITERKRIEDELRESENKLKSIFRSTPSGIGLVLDRVILEVNEQLCNMTGYVREELIGKSARMLYPTEDDYETVGIEKYRQIAEQGKGTVETRWLRKDGSVIDVLLSSSPLEAEDLSKGVTFTALDITRQKRAEDERISAERKFLHSQKLESLGVMAGGIAHDFNNLLMVIMGNLDLSLKMLPGDSPAQNNIERALQATRTAANLTRQMLDYSGKGKFLSSEVDLNGLIENNTDLYRASVPRGIVLDIDLSGGLPVIEADAGQIQQAIMNLIANAAEAIGDKAGTVTISTALVEAGAEELSRSRIEGRPGAGRFVRLELSDNGCGMDAGLQERIFDPFFSTKFTGRGLGMCAVLGIVRGHKGAIMIDSAVGEGTRVTILLPVTGQVAVAPEPSGGARPARQAAGTVLLVDDEAMVREASESMLKRLGFRVITAKDGEEAVNIFRARAREIDCVILDLSMPKMDGQAAFREMLSIESNVRVILVSGYSEREVTQRFPAREISWFIQKPYNLETLRKTMDRVFGKER